MKNWLYILLFSLFTWSCTDTVKDEFNRLGDPQLVGNWQIIDMNPIVPQYLELFDLVAQFNMNLSFIAYQPHYDNPNYRFEGSWGQYRSNEITCEGFDGKRQFLRTHIAPNTDSTVWVKWIEKGLEIKGIRTISPITAPQTPRPSIIEDRVNRLLYGTWRLSRLECLESNDFSDLNCEPNAELSFQKDGSYTYLYRACDLLYKGVYKFDYDPIDKKASIIFSAGPYPSLSFVNMWIDSDRQLRELILHIVIKDRNYKFVFSK